ncbi:MAG TPA: glycosyltransferase family 1 protein [Xanthobacteraceae bacterium]|jgi:glycosyltransferase involved in cell wall biosynthesis|nr:glycosyltransferase family 1 protein [Xanthobacteraceae bacterium]
MRVLIATDAWYPQVNGVVQTLMSVGRALERMGVEVSFLTPEGIPSVPLPTYPDIRLALPRARDIAERIDAIQPDVIHIATEGPIGHIVRRHCLKRRRGFTTSFHTRFADYAAARLPIPRSLSWCWLRWFHNAGRVTMASTESLSNELAARGFRKLMRWPRGVDTNLFQPRFGCDLGLPRPVFLSVGRVAVEKNIEAFLALDLPGSKVVVGDGPARQELALRYPSAVFLGTKKGQELADVYASADVFVFPSRTDTFGLVLLEALASGLPIAGFPVDSNRDVVGSAPVAALDEDLRAACLKSLTLSRAACRAYAKTMTWDESARCFLNNLKSSGALQVRREPHAVSSAGAPLAGAA